MNRTFLTWDALGRKVRERNWHYDLASQYDAAGNRTRLTWQDGFAVDYQYDGLSRLTAVREGPFTLLASYGYDSLGRRTSLARGNGTSTAWSYDAAGRPAGLTQDLGGSASDQVLTFAYNPAGQIASRSGSNDGYAFTGLANATTGYTSDGLNRYSAVGAIAPTYDGRGNLTSAGSQTYQYSKTNRLYTAPGIGTFYADPLERLQQVGAEGLLLANDGAQVVTERVESGPGAIARRYVYGADPAPLVWYEGSGTSDKRWLHADERGSVIAVSDGSGNALTRIGYDDYGNASATNATYRGRFGYTGQAWLPSLGLWYYRARMYSPSLGRFLQTDPIGMAGGINLYNYVGSDPVNYTDPMGLEEEVVHGEVTVTGELVKRVAAPAAFSTGGALLGLSGAWSRGSTPSIFEDLLNPVESGEVTVTAKPKPKPQPGKATPVKSVYDPRINYCGGGNGMRFPNDRINVACFRHDNCYNGSGVPKTQCDAILGMEIFFRRLLAKPLQLEIGQAAVWGVIYGSAVFIGGKEFYVSKR